MRLKHAGKEALRLTTHDPRVSDGVVSESYAGPVGRAYLTRRTYEDGVVEHFTGTTPRQVAVRRRWLPDGTVLHMRGPRGSEVVTRVTHTPRASAAPVSSAAPVDSVDSVEVCGLIDGLKIESGPPAPADFPTGAAVRPHGLKRNDLNCRAGSVVGWNGETARVGPAIALRLRTILQVALDDGS